MGDYESYDDALLRHAVDLDGIDEDVDLVVATTPDTRELVRVLIAAAAAREKVITDHLAGTCGCQN